MPPKKRAAFDVFLAHNSRDKPAVEAIQAALEARGVRTWLDMDQIPPGRWFQDLIQQAIPQVASAAIFFGPHGVGRWQAVEIRSFVSECVERGIPVIPVVLPGADGLPSELRFLKELNWVRFPAADDPQALDQLTWGITGTRPAKSRKATAPPVKKGAAKPPARAVRVDDSADWLLLDGRFYRSPSCAHAPDQTVTTEVVTQGSEDEAAVRSLDPGPYGNRKTVMFAHGSHAFDARVQSVQSKATGTTTIWTLILRPEQRQGNSLFAVTLGNVDGRSYTPEQTAELRARRILLAETMPSDNRRGFPGLLDGVTTVTEHPTLAQVFALSGRTPQVFLRQARLTLLYRLLTSHVVERVQRLVLTLKTRKTLHIAFQGVRAAVYSNKPALVVTVDGERTLA